MTGPTEPQWGQQPPNGEQPKYGQQPYGQPQYTQPQYGQPQYGPPQHGQHQYGQSQMGPMTTRFAKLDPGPSYGFGIVGATLAVVGAVLGVVAFTAVNWYSQDTGETTSHFGDVHRLVARLDSLGFANSLSVAYFGWLAWVLLIVGLVAAIVANLPVPGVGAFRVIGAVLGLAGAAASFIAIKFYTGPTGNGDIPSGYGDYLKHARSGFYLAVVGFVLIAAGSLIGPSRRRG
ncbi:MAG: hypothetical protein ACRDWT_14185 [Jatrophihabitantaceae bacterium]